MSWISSQAQRAAEEREAAERSAQDAAMARNAELLARMAGGPEGQGVTVPYDAQDREWR